MFLRSDLLFNMFQIFRFRILTFIKLFLTGFNLNAQNTLLVRIMSRNQAGNQKSNHIHSLTSRKSPVFIANYIPLKGIKDGV